jgi:hypothetical protein
MKCKGQNRICLVPDRDQWLGLFNMEIKFRVLRASCAVTFLTEEILAAQEGL